MTNKHDSIEEAFNADPKLAGGSIEPRPLPPTTATEANSTTLAQIKRKQAFVRLLCLALSGLGSVAFFLPWQPGGTIGGVIALIIALCVGWFGGLSMEELERIAATLAARTDSLKAPEKKEGDK